MRSLWLAFALVGASCGSRPARTVIANGTVCRTVATDIWATQDRPESTLSTSMRFDSVGHVVLAVERRKLASERVEIRSRFVWTPAGELASIERSSAKPIVETADHATFQYGSHHEIVGAAVETSEHVVAEQLTYVWHGTFEEVGAGTGFHVPTHAVPAFGRDLPATLVSPSLDDPMPAISFTGDVSISDPHDPDHPEVMHYERGLLSTMTHALDPNEQNADEKDATYTFDERGRELKTREGISETRYAWDRGRVVRRTLQWSKASDEVDYEYAPDGRLARERMTDGSHVSTGETTWSDACPSE